MLSVRIIEPIGKKPIEKSEKKSAILKMSKT